MCYIYVEVKNDKVGDEPVGVIVTGTRRGFDATASMCGENLCKKYRP